jgi:hypothetical protein
MATVFAFHAEHGAQMPKKAAVDEWYLRLQAEVQSLRPKIDIVHDAQARAELHARSVADREIGLANKLISEIREKGPVAILDILHFCQTAESLNINHADVDYLRSVSEAVLNRTAPPSPLVRRYICFWLDGSDGYSRPFWLDTKYGAVIFIFLGDIVSFGLLARTAQDRVSPNLALRGAVLEVASEYDVAPSVLGSVYPPFEMEVSVVIEGSSKFTSLIRELSDGTIWDS